MTRRGRKSPADHQRSLNAAFNFLGMPQFTKAVREYKPRKQSTERRERDVLADILTALRKHPLVATVERRQSGSFQDGARYIKVGKRGDPDITGILHGGRAYAIEVKREGEYPSEIQWKRIYALRAAGALAGCAHSVVEALGIING